ncbi:hypothetical protein GUJ93_ZPchr0012g21090 [Zizania palustris]|uniref:Uncharacterized protein n=1 Tax=Zizania palustris TaxID=103762 RepID=A0A8J5WRE0_ZIZPA|nr:hypothetical protein GUJ93_ZPchr0012g21090 [Zizania palustris]
MSELKKLKPTPEIQHLNARKRPSGRYAAKIRDLIDPYTTRHRCRSPLPYTARHCRWQLRGLLLPRLERCCRLPWPPSSSASPHCFCLRPDLRSCWMPRFSDQKGVPTSRRVSARHCRSLCADDSVARG